MVKKSSFLIIVVILLISTSCSVLTKSQIEAINNLSLVSDTLTNSPAFIFETLRDVRTNRGMFYASSLSSGKLQVDELNAISDQRVVDDKMVKKGYLYTQALNSYIKVLISLSDPIRYQNIGRELRGIGKNTDNLITLHNSINQEGIKDGDVDEIPVGLGKISGKYIGFAAETFMKYRQAYLLKQYISECDTVVGHCVDELTEILQGGLLDTLIINESKGLSDNYEAYISTFLNNNHPIEIGATIHYMELCEKITDAKNIRDKCVSGLKAFKRAHSKLIIKLKEKGEIEYIYNEYIELAAINNQLSEYIKKHKTTASSLSH